MADEKVELEKITTVEDAPLVRPGYPRGAGYTEGSPYGYGYGESLDRMHAREVWRVIRKHKFLIAIIALIVTTLVTIDAYRDKSIYQASALIEIGRDQNSMMKIGDIFFPMDDFTSTLEIKTSILKLKSRPVLESVADNLKLDKNPRFLESRRRSISEALAVITGKASDQPPGPALSEGPPMLEPAGTSERSAADSKRLGPYVGVLAGGLNVEQIRDTRALKVAFSHTDPRIAADVANGVAQDFIDRNFKSKTEKVTGTSDWLEKKTQELESNVARAEKELADYQRENNIFSTEGKATLIADKLSRLHDQAVRAETERIIKESLYQEVKAGRLDSLTEAFADAGIGGAQKRLGELELELAQLSIKFGPDNPNVKKVNEEIAALRSQLAGSRTRLEEKLRAQYEQASRDEQAFKAALERAKGEASEQNQALIQYNILKQNVETAKSIYTDFLQRYNQSKIQVAEQHNNMRIIEPAQTPGGPIGPNRSRSIAIALFLSLGAGVALAFFLNYLDNTVKTVEDVSRYAQLPALSVIPALSGSNLRNLPGRKGKKALPATGSQPRPEGASAAELMALDNRSAAAEAYRVLRTSVLLSSAGSPPKMILVTSGQPGEGKTTTVVNMGISLAQLGASVIIVDCDLRKPSTHKLFGVDHVRGLSTYLARNIEIDSVTQKLQIRNLSLIPCGPIPPNPAELISSEKMKDLLRLLAEKYDHVLIDSPPLINVTDPVILSTMVDGVILVVHGGKSTRDVVRRARQELSSVGAKIFGVVLNNVDLRREGYDYYYYYRYYSDYYGEHRPDGTGDLHDPR
jgi:capsular exopolysaccharide synthesis family protein